jgi:hypothetical protein
MVKFRRSDEGNRHGVKTVFCERRSKMPFINIKVLKGTLSKEKKDEMIKRVSETVAEIEASPNPKDSLLG